MNIQLGGVIDLVNVANWPLWAQVVGVLGGVWCLWKALYWGPAT